MKERPILFSAPMVRALLDGNKTQTRRVCKPAESAGLSYVVGIQDPRDFGQRPLEVPGSGWFGDEDGEVQFCSPYGRPGDRLWVRETWVHINDENDKFDGMGSQTYYRASIQNVERDTKWLKARGMRWRPSIHMPRWASRILLDVVSVRVERLQEISEADAVAEGIIPHVRGGWHWHKHDHTNVDDWHQFGFKTAAFAYEDLWEQINGPGSWDANPWVWVIEFKRVMP